jgi:flavin reductase
MAATSAYPPPRSTGESLRERFVGAMGNAATPVTVVATDGGAGRFGQTVSAMCSVSADPPLVLVCIHGRSPMNAAIDGNGVFCVNVLATRHDHVADTFAGRPWPGKERWDFSCGDWESAPSGAPLLVDALTGFDCAVQHVLTAGTHRIYVGTPLVYADRVYGRPEPVEPSTFPDFPEAHPGNRTRSRRR